MHVRPGSKRHPIPSTPEASSRVAVKGKIRLVFVPGMNLNEPNGALRLSPVIVDPSWEMVQWVWEALDAQYVLAGPDEVIEALAQLDDGNEDDLNPMDEFSARYEEQRDLTFLQVIEADAADLQDDEDSVLSEEGVTLIWLGYEVIDVEADSEEEE